MTSADTTRDPIYTCIGRREIGSIQLHEGALRAETKEERVKGLLTIFCIAGLLTAPSLSLAHPQVVQAGHETDKRE